VHATEFEGVHVVAHCCVTLIGVVENLAFS